MTNLYSKIQHKTCTCSFLSKSVHVMVKNIAQHILKHLNRYDIGCVIGMHSINMYKLGLLCGSACFSRPSHVVDARAGCLIRPVPELIVKGILLLLCGHASCTNMGISHAKHSMKKGRSVVWMSSNRYSLQPKQAGHFCIFLFAMHPRFLLPHLLNHHPIHPPLAPISECGPMSYGMALQCAETAEVMDTARVRAASCVECK